MVTLEGAIKDFWSFEATLFLYIDLKGGFLSESANRFSYLPKNIPNFYLELS